MSRIIGGIVSSKPNVGTLLLHCAECRQTFAFTDGEQAFYARRGLGERPRRCPACRARKKRSERARFGGLSRVGREANAAAPAPSEKPAPPRETISTAISTYRGSCATCGAAAEVSFRPAIGRPVYCRECYTARQSRGSAYGLRGPAGGGA
jgi:CxxC-x17-CxxC domain-containing protein